ncbi:MAG: hypothetical protein CMJ83_20835, partial [Planctomycetes bacterium]|nr:hypothetical protein [Planctomycetota bacterium]
FLYGWCLLLVINTGTLAALAVVFSSNLAKIVPMQTEPVWATSWGVSLTVQDLIGISMIVSLAVVNHFGVRWGALFQNVSTTAKLLALGAIVVGGFFAFDADVEAPPTDAVAPPMPDLVSGMVIAAVALFWAYEGWHQLAFSAAEMKDPKRDIGRGLIIGIVVLVVTYLAVNAVYLHVIPLEEMRRYGGDADVPHAAMVRIFGGAAGSWFAALICLSVYGASNPNMLSAPRAFYAMAKDGAVPEVLTRVHSRWRTPHVAIWVQTAWAVLLLFLLKTFENLTEFVVFAALIFYALVVAGVFALRRRKPDLDRPFRCPGYPVTPLLFIAVVLFVDIRLLMQEDDRDNALKGLVIIGAVVLAWPVKQWFSARSRGVD